MLFRSYAALASPNFTGNISIVDNSSSAALRVTQTGAGNALVVEDSANPDSTPFVVDASGNVGIGTTGPIAALDLYNATAAQAVVRGDSGTNIVVRRASTDSTQPILYLDKSRGTNASGAAVANGDAAGSVAFRAFDGTSYIQTAQITSQVDGTPRSEEHTSELQSH